MGIVNRTKDSSEQRITHVFTQPAEVATGATIFAFIAPWPCVLEQAKLTCMGVSGAPKWSLQKGQFIVGAGVTTISTGASLVVPVWGISGLGSFSLPATTSTLVNLSAGDMIIAATGVANTSTVGPCLELVIRKLQDVVTHFGL